MTWPAPDDVIETFVREVVATRKYHDICQDTVRDVIATALPKYKRPRDAIKAARTKLHRIQAAYLGQTEIADHLDEIAGAHRAGDRDRVKAICRRLMRDHASTRERIDLLDRFYRDVFAVTGPPRVVLDVACGMHPLSIPWMGLPDDVVYHAYEITGGLVDCLNGFLTALGLAGPDGSDLVKLQDVICTPPTEQGDLAFLMKMVPCLERREKGIAVRLIDSLRVDQVVVTFPVRSLAGRSKHMPEFYAQTFAEMVDGHGWRLIQVPMEGELVFAVDKRTA
ncbi:MAG: hypothetical protein JXQ73_10250 [Phycisphaerae bacterium]|nr:hypothetical protein [Phycisphaerae bacterium]